MKCHCFQESNVAMVVGIFALFGMQTLASTLHVWQQSQTPIPPYESWATAAHVIQNAVDAATDGDTVLVTNGVYSSGGRAVHGTMTNRVVINRPINLLSVNGPECTVIEGAKASEGDAYGNGDGAMRCVYMTDGAVLKGFTLTNGATRCVTPAGKFFYSCTTPLPNIGIGNITNEPAFLNVAAGDYRLAYGSTCIDAGTNLGASFTPDLNGMPRPLDGNGDGVALFDLGAYEFDLPAIIPTKWFARYGLDPDDPHVVSGDPDHDLFTTFQEWQADTDPTNDQSFFRIDHIEAVSNGLTAAVYFHSSSNRRYTLFGVTHLDGSGMVWASLPEQIAIPGSGGMDTLTDPRTVRQKFYKVGVDAQPYYLRNMVWIPPGTFTMGSPVDEVDRFIEEDPLTEVTISRGFWMGKYEVTPGEYLEVMGSNPSFFRNGSLPHGETDRAVTNELIHPVEQVSWMDATNYCDLLTQRERMAGRLSDEYLYRLPTEAEREYACRAGTSMRFSYGDDPGYVMLADYEWYADNSDGMTHQIGQKLPNPWGLYDMSGNVREWCQDWFGDYPGGNAVDPQGPEWGSIYTRVIRGGCFYLSGRYCRSAFRGQAHPTDGDFTLGFRIVLAPVP